MQPHAADARDQPVGEAAGQLASELLVLPVLAPSGDHVGSGVELREQLADVGGIVLEIAVHRDDHLAAGRFDARAHRRGLAEIEPEADHVQLGPLRGDFLKREEGAVAAAVVDADHFPRAPELAELGEELVEQRRDVLLFVEEWNDHRDLRRQGHRDVG